MSTGPKRSRQVNRAISNAISANEVVAAEWRNVIKPRRDRMAGVLGPDDAVRDSRVAPAPGGGAALAAATASDDHELTGLSLSGGGIRSASFCIGGMQALAATDVFRHLDYASSVSGGGYANLALQTAMAAPGAAGFPFLPSVPTDMGDSEAISKLRDRSNFLVPLGVTDLMADLAIVIRGIFANLLAVSKWLFAGALLIVALEALPQWHWAKSVTGLIGKLGLCSMTGFPATELTFLAVALYFVLYAILHGGHREGDLYERFGWKSRLGWIGLLLIPIVLFLEVQAAALEFARHLHMPSLANLGTTWQGLLPVLTAVLPVISSLTGIASKVTRVADRRSIGTTWRSWAKILAARLVYWVICLLLPVTLWLVSLILASRAIDGTMFPVAEMLGGFPVWQIYIGLFVVAYLLGRAAGGDMNANTLHGLYRSRLEKAFVTAGQKGATPTMSQLHGSAKPNPVPYPIINAALNISTSGGNNMRGRNATFYMFSPLYSGSPVTGYYPTNQVEGINPGLDCATVMAISGAAASSHMGAISAPMLAPTLALLNIRLGYWMVNPNQRAVKGWFDRLGLMREVFGFITDDSHMLYLTDGGHIEDLGLYELLRRRCRVIIAFDGEADPDMSFSSLIILQRYARIDLGVKIDLPWEKIGKEQPLPNGGTAKVHCAIGRITYSLAPDDDGILIYFKSSLSGDENDYIRRYAEENPMFPHESTGDQFFSEAQFEAYRGLGFHAVYDTLTGKAPAVLEAGLGSFGVVNPGFNVSQRSRQVLARMGLTL